MLHKIYILDLQDFITLLHLHIGLRTHEGSSIDRHNITAMYGIIKL